MIHIDNRYLNGLRRNDIPTVNEIYKKFAAKITTYICNNSGDANDAADIFQESLVYIYNRSLSENFVLTCPFEAYLFMVCKNRWINVLEKRKNKKVTLMPEDGYINMADQNGIKLMETKEQKLQLIDAALEKIGEGCVSLLKLSWQGLGMEEVGKQLNMTYAYVRKKKSECMGKLVELVKKEPNYQSLIG